MLTEESNDSATEDSAPPVADAPPADSSARFQSQLSDEYRLRPAAFLVVVLFCGLFLLLNYLPLRGTDLWLHVNLGDWILEHRQLPTHDPFMKLAEGMPLVDSAWLSQVIFAATDRSGGPHALSALFAACMFVAYLVLALAFYRRTGSALLVLCLTLLALVVGWSRLTTIRPENFAFLAFACLLWIGFAEKPSNDESDNQRAGPSLLQWLALPLLTMLWANLHGSFPMGLLVIGSLALGRWLTAIGHTRSLFKPLAERHVRGWIWLFQFCLLATLVNPHGIDLWLETFWFASRGNLRTILEWQPMVLTNVGGREFAASIVVLLVVLRWSRLRMTPTEVLLLILFGTAPLFGIRMLTWYAPVLAMVVGPHLADCIAQIVVCFRGDMPAESTPDEADPAPPPTGVIAWKYSLLSLLAIWVAFSLSPWSHQVLGTKLRGEGQLYDSQSTPLALTAYLNENAPVGQTFHPQLWGDWLVRRGPADFQVYVTSNIHTVPRQVWRDYNRINRFAPGWQSALDRYDVTTWIVDKQAYPDTKYTLRTNQDWRLAYEDDQSLVYIRQ